MNKAVVTLSFPIIRLYDLEKAGLIILWPSGVRYSNQTAGVCCNQPEAEGIFVPLENDLARLTHGVEQDLYSYFTSDKLAGRGGDGGLDSEDCEKISAILAKHRLDECLTIDLARRSDSHEAWIYVYLKTQPGQYGPPVEGFGELPLSAILTWGNSD